MSDCRAGATANVKRNENTHLVSPNPPLVFRTSPEETAAVAPSAAAVKAITHERDAHLWACQMC
jgi:hypothetical protein